MDDVAHLPYSTADRTPPNHSSCDFAHLLYVALGYARRLGLSRDDASDCAMQFVEKIWTDGTPLNPGADPPDPHEPWLRVCLRNHTLDYVRRVHRLNRKEAPWPEDEDSHYQRNLRDPTDRHAPDEALCAGLICEQVERALCKLSLEQRDLFVRHFVDGDDLAALAAATGRTANALRQSLFQTRRRVRAALERAGWTEQELRECLTPPLIRESSDTHYPAISSLSERSDEIGPNTS